jgi:hypothetical protein
VLKHRASELDEPIQMCGALSRNLPGELKMIVANCLVAFVPRFKSGFLLDVRQRYLAVVERRQLTPLA